jgi:hypothetical protein
MKRHARYQAMLATQRDLSPRQHAALTQHLSRCAACQDEAAAFATQPSALITLRGTLPPSDIRENVLAEAHRVRLCHTPFITRMRAVQLAIVGVVLAAVAINSPLPRALGITPGASVTPGPPPGFVCLPSGAAIPSDYHIIASPSDFKTGRHGWIHQSAVASVANEIAQPTWYYYYQGAASEMSSCRAHITTVDIEVGVNPDGPGTELHAVGALTGFQP